MFYRRHWFYPTPYCPKKPRSRVQNQRLCTEQGQSAPWRLQYVVFFDDYFFHTFLCVHLVWEFVRLSDWVIIHLHIQQSCSKILHTQRYWNASWKKKVLITLFCKYSMFKKKKKIGEKECIWNLEHFRNCIWKKTFFLGSILIQVLEFCRLTSVREFEMDIWVDLSFHNVHFAITIIWLVIRAFVWLWFCEGQGLFAWFFMWYVVIDRSSESLTGKTRWKEYCWVTVSLYLSPQHCQILSYA